MNEEQARREQLYKEQMKLFDAGVEQLREAGCEIIAVRKITGSFPNVEVRLCDGLEVVVAMAQRDSYNKMKMVWESRVRKSVEVDEDTLLNILGTPEGPSGPNTLWLNLSYVDISGDTPVGSVRAIVSTLKDLSTDMKEAANNLKKKGKELEAMVEKAEGALSNGNPEGR